MAKKTLRKGDNHKKKTRSKRRGGILSFDRFSKYFSRTLKEQQRTMENKKEKEEMHKKDEKEIEEGRRKRLVKDRIEDMKMFPEKYYVEKRNDIDNNPSIEGRELIKLLIKPKDERTQEEQNIIDNGNFYIYLTSYQESTDTTINIKLILGKAQDPYYGYGYTVQFEKKSIFQNIDIGIVKSFYYTYDNTIEDSVEISNVQQPGGIKEEEEDEKPREYFERKTAEEENAAEKEKETNQPGGKRRSRKKRNMKKSKKGKSKNRR